MRMRIVVMGLALSALMAVQAPSHAYLNCGVTAYTPWQTMTVNWPAYVWEIGYGASSSCSSSAPMGEHGLRITLQRHSWGPVWNNLAVTHAGGFGQTHASGQGTWVCTPETFNDFRTVGDLSALNEDLESDISQDVSSIAYATWCPAIVIQP